ncbi:MAG: hypothetical protein IKJ16_00550 [Agathobacter sp.]|nr:hypothetical protein [Agathobacter sp.]
MFKLYLKKLILIIGFCFTILGVYFLCYPFIATIANFFKNSPLQYAILFGVPTFFVLILVYNGRVQDQKLRKAYVKYIRTKDSKNLIDKIKDEIVYLKSFQSLQAELLAFSTLILPFVVAIGVTADSEAPFFANVLAGITLFAVFVGSYLILDVLFWVLVHKKWLK